MAIDIGSPAIDRPTFISGLQAYIIKENPANDSGVITKIQIYVYQTIANITFFTAYNTGVEDTFTTRDYQYIVGPWAAGYHEINVNIDVQTGDYLGWFCDVTEERIECDITVGVGYWRNPDISTHGAIPFTNSLFIEEDLTRTMSVYGIGARPPTVTVQAVTAITANTATGNGNITDLGDANPTAHGHCWNLTGSPTVGDDHNDEGAASATGAYTSDIIGLSPVTHYYVRSYATNIYGTAYSVNDVEFDTLSGIMAGLNPIFMKALRLV